MRMAVSQGWGSLSSTCFPLASLASQSGARSRFPLPAATPDPRPLSRRRALSLRLPSRAIAPPLARNRGRRARRGRAAAPCAASQGSRRGRPAPARPLRWRLACSNVLFLSLSSAPRRPPALQPSRAGAAPDFWPGVSAQDARALESSAPSGLCCSRPARLGRLSAWRRAGLRPSPPCPVPGTGGARAPLCSLLFHRPFVRLGRSTPCSGGSSWRVALIGGASSGWRLGRIAVSGARAFMQASGVGGRARFALLLAQSGRAVFPVGRASPRPAVAARPWRVLFAPGPAPGCPGVGLALAHVVGLGLSGCCLGGRALFARLLSFVFVALGPPFHGSSRLLFSVGLIALWPRRGLA